MQEHYDLLIQSQYWPADQMAQYQRSLLEPLLRHARDHVPFYARRLDAMFRSDGSVNWESWGEIPIVSRQDLITHHESMQAQQESPGQGKTRKFQTSGTSGIPVTTTHNGLATSRNAGTLWRQHRWFNLDPARTVCQWMDHNPTVQNLGPWGPPDDPRSKSGRFLVVSLTEPVEAFLRIASHYGATCLCGRPQALQMLALEAERQGIECHFEAVMPYGANVFDNEREDFRRVFGASCLALYSSKEGHKLAVSCPNGSHYHINSELVRLEILDETGKPCEPGQMGRVIITPFYNLAQPLIRYDQGDMAVVGSSCTCGSTLPVIEKILGRATQMFRFPGNRLVAPGVSNEDKKDYLASTAVQMAQVGPMEIEVRYVAEFEASLVNRRKFAKAVRQFTYPLVVVTFKRLDTVPLTPAGKFLDIVCELDENNSYQVIRSA